MATTIDAPARTGHVAETTPYAWPWNGALDATRTAVLVIEAPGEAGDVDHEYVRNAEVVVATLRRGGGAAIRVLTRRASATRPFAGASSAFADEGTGEIPTDDTVVSRGVDGFFGSPLETVLRQARIERLILVGAWLETSVHSTMRTANDMGFECLLVVDACAPGDADLVANSVSMIEMSGGIFGAVGTTARVVEAYAREEGERA
ncbi:cysteine hydrolase family protein [Microbacterium allomyrinae]|uniref:Isochorismatase family protein n=1 Tax=Microbacterium allomyrinae TaxID=2830666 RepID=A0A9X1S3H8_9MICO|nr:isochorismatase family protein [Microbacterium allomyrinae]MCC2033209.1 isochorismatase family protein [Microbacterium allomyrinae]